MKYAISACLMGTNCKYSGGNNFNAELAEFMQDKEYILVCPEMLGGLPVPRVPCEKVGDKVMGKDGTDCTMEFYKGAELALAQLREFGAELVILQERSPSCGTSMVYDGTFSGKLLPGKGVFGTLLEENGIKAMSAEAFLKSV